MAEEQNEKEDCIAVCNAASLLPDCLHKIAIGHSVSEIIIEQRNSWEALYIMLLHGAALRTHGDPQQICCKKLLPGISIMHVVNKVNNDD